MIRETPFVEGEFYHIYNRGTDKRKIFMSHHDHRRFMTLLYLCNDTKPVNIDAELEKGRTFPELMDIERDEPLVDIAAYCLMPNHFHILIREKEKNNISTFMKKLSTAYSMYFNKKQGRSGSLFESRFKSRHVDNEAYFHYLFAYIHLNPAKLVEPHWKERGVLHVKKFTDFMRTYPYSSYHEYFTDHRKEAAIVNKNVLPDYLQQIDGVSEILKIFQDTKDAL